MVKSKTPKDFVDLYEKLKHELGRVVKGQDEVITFVVLALLSDGHILLEGFPGLGKTLLVNALSYLISADFKRIQFTPDLMPVDIIGTTVFNYEKNEFVVKKGPLFANFLLADEINRTPAKTQAALLEAMQERQVTIDGVRYPLDEPFITIATQNPIEMEGTYPLPEAELDRFLCKILISYPPAEHEKEILSMYCAGFDSRELDSVGLQRICTKTEFLAYKKSLTIVNIEDSIISYIFDIVDATRKTPGIEVGASPRGGIALLKLSRALAAVRGREFVVPDDVKDAALPSLRHRLILESSAELEGTTADDLVNLVLSKVKVPR
jgi:MoxR-like ATPase